MTFDPVPEPDSDFKAPIDVPFRIQAVLIVRRVIDVTGHSAFRFIIEKSAHYEAGLTEIADALAKVYDTGYAAGCKAGVKAANRENVRE